MTEEKRLISFGELCSGGEELGGDGCGYRFNQEGCYPATCSHPMVDHEEIDPGSCPRWQSLEIPVETLKCAMCKDDFIVEYESQKLCHRCILGSI